MLSYLYESSTTDWQCWVTCMSHHTRLAMLSYLYESSQQTGNVELPVWVITTDWQRGVTCMSHHTRLATWSYLYESSHQTGNVELPVWVAVSVVVTEQIIFSTLFISCNFQRLINRWEKVFTQVRNLATAHKMQ